MRKRPFGASPGWVGVAAVISVLIVASLSAIGYGWAIGPIAHAPESGPVPAVGLPTGPVVAAWELRDATTKVASGNLADLVSLVVVDGRSQVHVLPLPLTDACHQSIFGLVLSPDGTKVAVTGSVNCNTTPFASSVRVVDVLHGVVVGTVPGGDGGVAWAPDSTRLVVANLHQPGDIATPTGTVSGHLPSGIEPHWAPASMIALSTYDANENVVVFRSDATPLTQLSGYRSGRWIRDNVFAAGTGDVTDLLAVDTSGKAPAKVTRLQTYPCPSRPLSPDGTTVVGLADTTVGAFKNTASFLQSCDVMTGYLKRLTANYGASELENGTAWLPNGLIAVLIGPTYQTIDVKTGRHRTFAYSSGGFHFFFGLTTVAGS